jgi:sugar lactone lactonase YvrE
MIMSPLVRDVRVPFEGILSNPRLDYAECVAVADDGSWWCGGEAGQIFRIADGVIEQVASTGGFTLGIGFGADGTLYGCDMAVPGVWSLLAGSSTPIFLPPPVDGHELMTPNFPLVLPDGSLMVTDSGQHMVPRPGLLHYDQDGRGALWHPGPLNFANGLAFDATRGLLYVVESYGPTITRFEVNGDGSPASGPQVAARVDGYLPDGIAVDPARRIYVAVYEPSAILRIDLDGRVEELCRDEAATVLCHPTNIAFVGDNLLAANLGRWHLTLIELA